MTIEHTTLLPTTQSIPRQTSILRDADAVAPGATQHLSQCAICACGHSVVRHTLPYLLIRATAGPLILPVPARRACMQHMARAGGRHGRERLPRIRRLAAGRPHAAAHALASRWRRGRSSVRGPRPGSGDACAAPRRQRDGALSAHAALGGWQQHRRAAAGVRRADAARSVRPHSAAFRL